MLSMINAAALYAKTRIADERGATAVEYGLIVALIAAIIVAVVGLVGQDVLGGFQVVEDAVLGNDG